MRLKLKYLLYGLQTSINVHNTDNKLVCPISLNLIETITYEKHLILDNIFPPDINPLKPSVSISILLTGRHTFVVVLVGRSTSCSDIKQVHPW